jgi:hypothetical protein
MQKIIEKSFNDIDSGNTKRKRGYDWLCLWHGLAKPAFGESQEAISYC